MDEHLFSYCTIGHCNDPVFPATILTHDSVDDANVSVTLWIDHTTILARSHSGQNLVKAIHMFTQNSKKEYKGKSKKPRKKETLKSQDH